MNSCLVYIILGAILSLIIISAAIFAAKLSKFAFWHKPLGKDEWKYAQEKLEPNFPGISSWIKERLAEGNMKEDTIRVGNEELHAYYMAHAEARGTVVLTHGYSGCALQMMPYARIWHEIFGCNVLVHDLPNHGRSSGTMTCMGKVEYLILLQWIKRAELLFPATDIYLQGISMGAATTVMALGEDSLPANVKGGIADSAFSTVGGELLDEMKGKTKGLLPLWYMKLVLWFLNRRMKSHSGWSIWDAPSPLSAAASIRVPVLYVCGNADLRVNNRHSQLLYDMTKNAPHRLFKTQGQGHCKSIIHDREGYLKAIEDLLFT